MKCFLKDADCREDCALYQEGYKTCAFAVIPILLAITAKQLKEIAEIIENLGYDLLQNNTDKCYSEESYLYEDWPEELSKGKENYQREKSDGIL